MRTEEDIKVFCSKAEFDEQIYRRELLDLISTVEDRELIKYYYKDENNKDKKQVKKTNEKKL